MIIQNNFNSRNAKPNDYQSIGKTRDNSLEKEEEIVKNSVIQDILDKDKEYDEDTPEVKDNWDFFR